MVNVNVEDFVDSLNKLCKKHHINLIATDCLKIRIIEENNVELVDDFSVVEDKDGFCIH
jgi:hypothetical protein